MNINLKGLSIIKEFESLKLNAYICPAGVPTIGYGHTGPEVDIGLTITQRQADDLLAKDLAKFELGVSGLVSVQLNENQFSALVSFAYNCGLANLQQSTLLRYVNARKFEQAADEFLKWNRARKMVLPGLTRRRMAERSLFLSGDFS